MYRGERDTSKWFTPDHSLPIQDRKNLPALAPGMNETENKALAYKSSVSWNTGKVPFASNNERFVNDTSTRWSPGPASYDPKKN